MQIGRKMTELEAFEVLSVVLEHPVYIYIYIYIYMYNILFKEVYITNVMSYTTIFVNKNIKILRQ